MYIFNRRHSVCFAFILLFSLNTFSVCEQFVNPKAVMNCYITEFQKLENKLNQAQHSMSQFLDQGQSKYMQRTVILWHQYMLAQCEFEARLLTEPRLRPVKTSICRYRYTQHYLQNLSNLIQSLYKQLDVQREKRKKGA